MQQSAIAPTMSNDSLLQEFRSKTAPMSNLRSHSSAISASDAAAFSEMKSAFQQPQSGGDRMPRIPQNASAEITALKHKLEQCLSKVQTWNEILTEITQSVFILCATATIDSIPYYSEIPTSERDIASAVGRLNAGDKVTLMYPQVVQDSFIFMRIRLVDVHSGDVQLFYTPIANQSLTRKQLGAAGITSDADQYFDWFHNPGDPDPCPTDVEGNL